MGGNQSWLKELPCAVQKEKVTSAYSKGWIFWHNKLSANSIEPKLKDLIKIRKGLDLVVLQINVCFLEMCVSLLQQGLVSWILSKLGLQNFGGKFNCN